MEEAAADEAEEKSLEVLEETDGLGDCKTEAVEDVEEDCVEEPIKLDDVDEVIKELLEVTDNVDDSEAAVEIDEYVEEELEDEDDGTITGGRSPIQAALQDVFLGFLVPTARFK